MALASVKRVLRHFINVDVSGYGPGERSIGVVSGYVVVSVSERCD
jgi:hypothetical protein